MIGIDLSEGRGYAVAVGPGGTPIARADASPSSRSSVTAALRRLRSAANPTTAEAPSAVGIATASPGEPVPEEIATAVAAAFDRPPSTIAAGLALALGEAWCGAAQGSNDVVAVALGRHVLSGAIVGGQLVRGAHDSAGAIGWLAVNPVERDDYRRYGGLEAEVSAAGIVKRLVWRIKSGEHSAVADQVGNDFSKIMPDAVLAAAQAGDGVSISVVRDTVKYVAMAVANLVTILDPEYVVIGGTLAVGGESMLEALRVECHRRLSSTQAERLRLVLSALGPDAVAIGAARAAELSSS